MFPESSKIKRRLALGKMVRVLLSSFDQGRESAFSGRLCEVEEAYPQVSGSRIWQDVGIGGLQGSCSIARGRPKPLTPSRNVLR